jgi:antitoxin HigA-1
MRPAIHPGEILQDELVSLSLSASALALALDVPANRISQILRGQRAITGDTALRLARYFNMTPQFWLGLQSAYDLRLAQNDMGDKLNRVQQRAA